jgi:hypothetical protein
MPIALQDGLLTWAALEEPLHKRLLREGAAAAGETDVLNSAASRLFVGR